MIDTIDAMVVVGRKRRNGSLEDVVDVAASMPWWASVTLALLAYPALHYFAARPEGAGTPADIGGLGAYAATELLRTLAGFMQYLVPLALGAGAFLSFVAARGNGARWFRRPRPRMASRRYGP